MIEEDVVAHVLAALEPLIGDRMEPLTRGETTDLPSVAYQVIDTPRVRSHNGPSGLAHPRIQFRAMSKSYMEAKEITKAIRVSLDGFRGQMNGRSVSCSVRGEHDDHDTIAKEFHRLIDVIIWHREEVI